MADAPDKSREVVAVSPDLAKVQIDSKPGNDTRPFSPNPSAVRTVNDAFDGGNPPAVVDSSKNDEVRAPSSFAQQLNFSLAKAQYLRDNPAMAAQLLAAKNKTDKPPGQPVAVARQPVTAPGRPVAVPGQLVRPATPGQAIKSIEDRLKETASLANKDKQSLEQETKKIIDDRNQLPVVRKVSTVAGIEKAAEEAVRKGVPLVVKFGAEWCGPCKKFQADVLSKMEGKGSGKVTAVFADIDIDKTGDKGVAIAKFLHINKSDSVPQLNVLAVNPADGRFKDGRHHNMGPMSYAEFKSRIPGPLEPDYVVQHRDAIITDLRDRLKAAQQGQDKPPRPGPRPRR